MTVIELSQVLGNFGEFFGAIAVVGTLVFLAIQVRHSKEATVVYGGFRQPRECQLSQ